MFDPRVPVTLLLAVLLLVACGGHVVREPEPPTREDLMVLSAEAEDGRHVFRARYNPPLCPCPAFEVRMGDRWIRVRVKDADPAQPVIEGLIQTARRDADPGGAGYYLIGTPDPDRIGHCATGFPVMDFEIEAFTRQPPEAWKTQPPPAFSPPPN